MSGAGHGGTARADGGGPGDGQATFSVRQVTNARASWRTESGGGGAFALQLILDHGAAKHVLPVEAQELRALLQLLRGSRRTSFDPARGLLVFADLELG